jgi:hypothetical protein
MLPVSARFCRRCGTAQQQSALDSGVPPMAPVILPEPRAPVRWLTFLGFFGLIGGALMLVTRGTATSPTAVEQVAAPQVVYPQPTQRVYPNWSLQQQPVYHERPLMPVYPEHEPSSYQRMDHEHR